MSDSHFAGLTLSRALLGCLLALVLALPAGCKSGPPATIEEIIAARIGEIEAAVREHRIKDLKEIISESYADDKNNSNTEVRQMLTYYFFRNKAIYPFIRIQSVTSEQEGRATAEFVAALSASPVSNSDELAGVRADLYHFVVEFALEDDEWMVRGAEWRPADIGDFL